MGAPFWMGVALVNHAHLHSQWMGVWGGLLCCVNNFSLKTADPLQGVLLLEVKKMIYIYIYIYIHICCLAFKSFSGLLV